MSTLTHPVRPSFDREPRGVRPGLRKTAVALFFASLTVNAVLGIGSLLVTDFDESDTALRVLQSSLVVTAFLLVALAVGPAWERRRFGPVPALAVLTASSAAVLVILEIWRAVDGETWAKLATSASFLTVALVAACLIGLARLEHRFAWVVPVTLGLLAVATALMLVVVWFEPDSNGFGRVVGVVAVLLGAFAAATPVLHWLSRPAIATREAATTVEARYCPFCGARGDATLGVGAVCSRCGTHYTVARPAR